MHPQFQRHLTETPYGYVHSRTFGEEKSEKPDLLLLHQIPASSRIWVPVMKELVGVNAIAPDALNLGESDRTSTQLTLEKHAETLWSVGQELSPGPKILVGHHTGAALASIMAARYSGMVRGTMLIGYPYYSSWEEKLSKYARLNPAISEPDASDLLDVWKFIRRAFEPDAPVDLVYEAFADRIRAGRVWYEGYVALWNSDLHGNLERLKVMPFPKQVIAPDQDILSKHAGQVAEIAGAELITCEGGAFMLTEDPATLALIISEFITTVSK